MIKNEELRQKREGKHNSVQNVKRVKRGESCALNAALVKYRLEQ